MKYYLKLFLIIFTTVTFGVQFVFACVPVPHLKNESVNTVTETATPQEINFSGFFEYIEGDTHPVLATAINNSSNYFYLIGNPGCIFQNGIHVRRDIDYPLVFLLVVVIFYGIYVTTKILSTKNNLRFITSFFLTIVSFVAVYSFNLFIFKNLIGIQYKSLGVGSTLLFLLGCVTSLYLFVRVLGKYDNSTTYSSFLVNVVVVLLKIIVIIFSIVLPFALLVAPLLYFRSF